MKKIFYILFLFFLIPNFVFAANVYTTDLEESSSQYFSITDANQTGLDITGDFSIMFWFNTESNNTRQSIYAKFDQDAGNDGILYVEFNTDNTFRVRWDYSGSAYTIVTSDSAINTDVGNWHHLALACDVSVPDCDMYLDGVSINSTASPTGATQIGDSSGSAIIGSYFNPTQFYFDGKLDEYIITNDILSSTEISNYYDCGITDQIDNIQGHWKFENNTLDETANTNDLTNNNSATFQATSTPFTDDCATSTPPSEATTTAAVAGSVPLFNTLTAVSYYEEEYGDSTTTPEKVRYGVYYIPFIWLIVIIFPIGFILMRLVIEISIILREKRKK